MAARAKLIPAVVACGMAGALAAQESEAPELSLLEFLGSWGDEGDDVWFIVDGLLDDGYEVEVDDSVLDPESAGVETDEEDVAVDAAEVAVDPQDTEGADDTFNGTDEVAAADAG